MGRTRLRVARYGVAAVLAATLLAAAVGSVAPHGTRLSSRAMVHNGHYCDGCRPPLRYYGGPVVDTSGADGFVVVPIYWLPDGGDYSFPAGYPETIDRYVADVAAASGQTTNVYSVATEYTGRAAGAAQRLRYKITAGPPLLDPNPFPASGCQPDGDQFTDCITDRQLRTELASFIAENKLPTGLSVFYPVFFPAGVETQDLDGSTSVDGYCGYHRSFGSGAGIVLYANEPFETEGCDGGQAPNGNLVTDGAIDVLSHELMETMTDPDEDAGAWSDASGAEIGDICTDFYGSPLGSTDPNDPTHSEYNQLINGHPYYTQTEFSNAAYSRFGVGNGCQPAEGAVSRAKAAGLIVFISDPYPAALPADGRTTSDVNLQIWNKRTNYGIRDTVSLSTHVIDGTGVCGSLSKTSGTTDAGGSLDVTYTASGDDVVCGIDATEAKTGKTTTGVVYQGAFRALAPTATARFPRVLRAGKASYFTVTFGNRTAKAIPFATVDFEIFPTANNSPNVRAAQVAMATSLHGLRGPFTLLHLSGSTVTDGAIQGRFVGPSGTGLTIPPHGRVTITFGIQLAASVPSRGRTPIIDLEAYLDQLNPATGAGSTVADTESSSVAVTPAG